MHLKRIQTVNLRDIADGFVDFSADERSVRRWIFLPEGAAGVAWMKCVALACAGQAQVEAVFKIGQPPVRDSAQTAQLLVERSWHTLQERPPHRATTSVAGWTWRDGKIESLPPQFTCGRMTTTNRPKRLVHGAGHLFVGYGTPLEARAGAENFDLHKDHRLARFVGLFGHPKLLTNPIVFLERLRHKAKYTTKGRLQSVLKRLDQELGGLTRVQPQGQEAMGHPAKIDLSGIEPRMRLAVCVVLDLTRQVIDASGRFGNHLEQSGVVVLDGFSNWFPDEKFPALARLLARLFPNLQFFLRLPQSARARFPRELRAQSLPLEVPVPAPRAPACVTLSSKGVLLIDVDGWLPNLALMKLSRYFKRHHRPVLLRRGVAIADRADTVYASCIFALPTSAKKVANLRERYGDKLNVGGSGVDLTLRLPPEIEAELPDFSLYPELGDRAIGFLTRGCPKRCSFCIVPKKEGPLRQVSDLDGLLQGRRQLILLDDNLLAHPQAVEWFEEMVRRDLAVNFNQTLDLSLLTPETAALLRRLRCQNVDFTRSNYHFSLNNTRRLETLRRRYELMRFGHRENVEFICLYGYDTTLAEDLERFAFLRTLPGAYVFVQQYLPHPDLRPPAPRPFFDDAAAAHLDALIKIVFPQNMKSMEKYYRWLCLEYARQCGKIHRPLLDTLYRYNFRQTRAGFESKLERLCGQS